MFGFRDGVGSDRRSRHFEFTHLGLMQLDEIRVDLFQQRSRFFLSARHVGDQHQCRFGALGCTSARATSPAQTSDRSSQVMPSFWSIPFALLLSLEILHEGLHDRIGQQLAKLGYGPIGTKSLDVADRHITLRRAGEQLLAGQGRL